MSLADGRSSVDVSVLVPAKDEAESLPEFMRQAEAALKGAAFTAEVVVVDDGSGDGTWAVLQTLAAKYPFLRPARHRLQRGIADALRTGYLRARGRVLVFYPADLQFKPEVHLGELRAHVPGGDAGRAVRPDDHFRGDFRPVGEPGAGAVTRLVDRSDQRLLPQHRALLLRVVRERSVELRPRHHRQQRLALGPGDFPAAAQGERDGPDLGPGRQLDLPRDGAE
jgi:glycosyltransferase involved in cell wall biosynthesis